MLWKAQIAPRKKAWLILMFSGGIFVMMAAILRCVLILTVSCTLRPDNPPKRRS